MPQRECQVRPNCVARRPAQGLHDSTHHGLGFYSTPLMPRHAAARLLVALPLSLRLLQLPQASVAPEIPKCNSHAVAPTVMSTDATLSESCLNKSLHCPSARAPEQPAWQICQTWSFVDGMTWLLAHFLRDRALVAQC